MAYKALYRTYRPKDFEEVRVATKKVKALRPTCNSEGVFSNISVTKETEDGHEPCPARIGLLDRRHRI